MDWPESAAAIGSEEPTELGTGEGVDGRSHVDTGAVDATDLVRLYERFGKQVYRFCLNHLGNREDAEDATQLTFFNVFRWISRNDSREVVSPLIFTIAQNVCLNSRRSVSRRQRVEILSDLDENFVSSRDFVSQREAVIRLPEALRALPPLQRRAILLREWRGLSYREIGSELALSDSATEALLFRARRSLIGLLSSEE